MRRRPSLQTWLKMRTLYKNRLMSMAYKNNENLSFKSMLVVQIGLDLVNKNDPCPTLSLRRSPLLHSMPTTWQLQVLWGERHHCHLMYITTHTRQMTAKPNVNKDETEEEGREGKYTAAIFTTERPPSMWSFDT